MGEDPVRRACPSPQRMRRSGHALCGVMVDEVPGNGHVSHCRTGEVLYVVGVHEVPVQ